MKFSLSFAKSRGSWEISNKIKYYIRIQSINYLIGVVVNYLLNYSGNYLPTQLFN
jgi:hypothetical protein